MSRLRRWEAVPARWLTVADELLALRLAPDALPAALRYRIQVTTLATTLPLLLAMPSVVLPGRTGLVTTGLLCGLAAAGTASNLALLRHTRAPVIAGIIGTGLLFLLLLVGALKAGGITGPMFGWLYVVPLVAALTADRPTALAFTGVVALCALAFFGLDPGRSAELGALVDRLSAILATGGLAWAFTEPRSSATIAFDEERTEEVHFLPDPGAGLEPEGRRLRVLVVVSGDAVRLAPRLERELAEHLVEVTADASAGTARFLDEDFDALVCDVQLAGSSGLDVRAAVEQLAADRRDRVVLMTSEPYGRAASVARRAGATVLDRPLDSGELRYALQGALGDDPAGRSQGSRRPMR